MEKTNLNSSITDNREYIKHTGLVTKISKDSVFVMLTENVNCSSCHAKSACGISDTETKIIEVFNNQKSFKINESVDVILGSNMGLKAVFFAYIFPFILLFLTLVISLSYLKEWQAGLLSLFILIPYYSLIYFLNNFLKSAFKITLLKLHQ
jgi:sigma-E factor negative regulatory protein RseC